MAQANTSVARSVRARAGMTLVEMLVAMTCTILLMLAITQTFQSIGEVSSRGRAAIEMSTQLRGVWLRLQEDLQAITVPVRPWPDADGASGYFEYYDGAGRDNTFITNPDNNVMGDVDDILAFTARSTGTPFVGRYTLNGNPTMIDSNVAEIIWFAQFVDTNSNNTYDAGESVTLHRRVLLVRPDLNNAQGILSNDTLANHYLSNDISVRQTANGLVANSLADLTQRENRYAHSGNFPTQFDLLNGALNKNNGWVLSGARLGEDVILSNVLAFDVRVFDKNATIQTKNGEPVSPGDPGYDDKTQPPANPVVGYGCFVDLYHGSNLTPAQFATYAGDFKGLPNSKSGLTVPIYDTWSYKYEHDGVNQNGNAATDEATDGLDNGGIAGAVDDVNERETAPPYAQPLRGIQVRLRVIERDTRQVRQATLVQDFLPE